MNKPTFLKYDKPLLTAMILCPTAGECIIKIKASLADGADALGIQLCRLKKEYRTKETLTEIFNACEGKPIYVTSYRYAESEGMSDEECMELLLLALDCGATLCDIMGDTFDPTEHFQLTENKAAIEKQKALIDEIHRRGGEVLISCHTMKSLTVDENLMIARAQLDRGTDIIKIVDGIDDINELPGYIESILKITEMTDKKLLFLLGSKGRLIRYVGANLGVCMYLCVQSYGDFDPPDLQPLLKDAKAVRDNLIL